MSWRFRPRTSFRLVSPKSSRYDHFRIELYLAQEYSYVVWFEPTSGRLRVIAHIAPLVKISSRHWLLNMACRECISGALHEGATVGREDNIHGLPTYISEPPEGQAPKGIIVIIPDAVGWQFNNNRILADSLAKNTTCRVLLPEFMDGHAMSPSLFQTMDTITGNGWMIGKM